MESSSRFLDKVQERREEHFHFFLLQREEGSVFFINEQPFLNPKCGILSQQFPIRRLPHSRTDDGDLAP